MAIRQKEIMIFSKPFVKLKSGQIYNPLDDPNLQFFIKDPATVPNPPEGNTCPRMKQLQLKDPHKFYSCVFKSNSYEQAINKYTQIIKDLPKDNLRMEILVPIDIEGTPRK